MQIWSMVQSHVARLDPNIGWDEPSPSRHFERCFTHPAGIRFETSGLHARVNAGTSVCTFTGRYFATASVYDQMRALAHFYEFKGGYHWTRFDAQVTTLNPSQSAEQIVEDVQKRRLWVKGYQGWESKGLTDFDGKPVNGLSACFGSPSSDRRATSYNKAAEQGWETPARRDEVRLRGDWAQRHMDDLATAVAGAASENEALDAYQQKTVRTIAQHMEYLDITGTPIPRPKDWARAAKAPKWWKETLETEYEPLRKSRRVESDVWKRFAHLRMQWGPTWAEACAELYATGRSGNVHQAAMDLAMVMLQGLKPEHVQRVAERLPKDMRAPFLDDMKIAADQAAIHVEEF